MHRLPDFLRLAAPLATRHGAKELRGITCPWVSLAPPTAMFLSPLTRLTLFL